MVLRTLLLSPQLCQLWSVKRHSEVHQWLLFASQTGRRLLLVMQEPSSVKRHHQEFCQSRQIIGSMRVLQLFHLRRAVLPVLVVRWQMLWRACWKFSANMCLSNAAELLIVLLLWARYFKCVLKWLLSVFAFHSCSSVWKIARWFILFDSLVTW